MPTEEDLAACAAHLDRLCVQQVINGATGRLVGFHDPDRHELSFYARSGPGARADALRPVRDAPPPTPNMTALAPTGIRSPGRAGHVVHLPRLTSDDSHAHPGRHHSRRLASVIALAMAVTLTVALVAVLIVATLASTTPHPDGPIPSPRPLSSLE